MNSWNIGTAPTCQVNKLRDDEFIEPCHTYYREYALKIRTTNRFFLELSYYGIDAVNNNF